MALGIPSPGGVEPSDRFAVERGMYPAHEPIRIRSDAELALPDEVAQNGVRGGMGTEDDPFRINRWRIDPTDEPAITISDVDAHVVISEIEVEPARDQDLPAIGLSNVSNLTIEEISMEGWPGPTVQTLDTDLKINNIEIKNGTSAEVLEFTRSSALIEKTTISNSPEGIVARNSELTVRSSNFTGIGEALQIHPPKPQPRGDPARGNLSVRVVDSTFTGGGISDQYGNVAIQVYATHLERQVFRGNRIQGWTTGIALDPSDGDGDRPTSSVLDVRIIGNRFHQNGIGIVGPVGGQKNDELRVARNVFTDQSTGFGGGNGSGEIVHNVFLGNRYGIKFHPNLASSPAYTIRSNAFEGNSKFAAYAHGEIKQISVPNNWWGDPDGPTRGWSAEDDGDQRDRITPNLDPEPVLTMWNETLGPDFPPGQQEDSEHAVPGPGALYVFFAVLLATLWLRSG
jgi:hypothetical protein